MYDKDVVWVNVSGCFNRGNLVGRFFIVELFGEFGFTNTWPDPLGAKVNDWYWTSKTQNAALEDQVAQMQHHSSFRQVLTLDSQDNEENDSSDDDSVSRITTTLKMTLMTLKTERKRKIGRKTGRFNHRLITRSLSSTSPEKNHRHRIRLERL